MRLITMLLQSIVIFFSHAGDNSGVHLYCPVIVKYRDEKTSGSITLEDLLR